MKKSPEKKERRHPLRTVAEWFSLAMSALLILALAAFLVYEAFRGNQPYVPIDVRPQWHQIQQAGEQFILPLQIENRGRQTVRDLRIEVKYEAPATKEGGKPTEEMTDLQIDYLGERSTREAFVYFEGSPAEAKVKVRPVSYRLD